MVRAVEPDRRCAEDVDRREECPGGEVLTLESLTMTAMTLRKDGMDAVTGKDDLRRAESVDCHVVVLKAAEREEADEHGDDDHQIENRKESRDDLLKDADLDPGGNRGGRDGEASRNMMILMMNMMSPSVEAGDLRVVHREREPGRRQGDVHVVEPAHAVVDADVVEPVDQLDAAWTTWTWRERSVR